jgi:hypothetical protein
MGNPLNIINCAEKSTISREQLEEILEKLPIDFKVMKGNCVFGNQLATIFSPVNVAYRGAQVITFTPGDGNRLSACFFGKDVEKFTPSMVMDRGANGGICSSYSFNPKELGVKGLDTSVTIDIYLFAP